MPKMKTHKSGLKRFRITATGKLIRNQAGRSHLNKHKTSKRKRRLDRLVTVHPTNVAKIKLEIPYMKYAHR